MVIRQTKTGTYFRERKEFNVTGLKVVCVRVMGCEAKKKDGRIKRDFVCLVKMLKFAFCKSKSRA